MGWETRKKGGRYYTRSRKANGRVVREYVGGGVIGEFASRMDAEEREEREARRAASRGERRRFDELDEISANVCRATGTILRAVLESAGYHQHKRGEWRKRREQE